MKKLIYHQRNVQNLKEYHYSIFQEDYPEELKNHKVLDKKKYVFFILISYI